MKRVEESESMLKNFNEIFTLLQSRGTRKRMVAAWGVDDHTISAAAKAVELGLVDVTLVGDRDMIGNVCEKEGIERSMFTVVHNPVEIEAVEEAVRMVRVLIIN